MNKFNKRIGSAGKERKIRKRVKAKQAGAEQHHKAVVKVSSGKRTGKAAKRREKAANLKVKADLEAAGMLDSEMKDAPKI